MGAAGFFARAGFFTSSTTYVAWPSPAVAEASGAGLGASAAFFLAGAFFGAGIFETCYSAVWMVESAPIYFFWLLTLILLLY